MWHIYRKVGKDKKWIEKENFLQNACDYISNLETTSINFVNQNLKNKKIDYTGYEWIIKWEKEEEEEVE
jgi:hypothetical protein